MFSLGLNPEKVFTFSKGGVFPAFILGLFLTYFFSVSEFPNTTYQTIHIMYIVSIIIAVVGAFYFRIFSTVMAVSVIYVSGLIINSIRQAYGEDYIFSASYNIWSILLLPNLLFSYFIFKRQEFAKYWSWFYILLLLETAVIEKLLAQSLITDSYYFYKHIGMLNYPALNVSVFCLLVFLIYYIDKGRILTAAAFFSAVAVFMGLYMSDNLVALELFFFAAVLIELVETVCYIFYVRYKDEELNVANYYSYCYEAEHKYPLKYSVTLMYIDEYERLLKRFGRQKMILLKKMFLERIKKENPTVSIYNYKKDALILAFKDKNATESHEEAENIRRALVKSIFVFNENNHLQLTVSQCVSEKKRSDANATVVLKRAEESLQKACKFTRNITIRA